MTESVASLTPTPSAPAAELVKPRHKMIMFAVGTFLLMVITGAAGYFMGYQQGRAETDFFSIERVSPSPQASSIPQPTFDPEVDAVACTLEAKICPDGTAVGRSGPNCEFAPCPEEN